MDGRDLSRGGTETPLRLQPALHESDHLVHGLDLIWLSADERVHRRCQTVFKKFIELTAVVLDHHVRDLSHDVRRDALRNQIVGELHAIRQELELVHDVAATTPALEEDLRLLSAIVEHFGFPIDLVCKRDLALGRQAQPVLQGEHDVVVQEARLLVELHLREALRTHVLQAVRPDEAVARHDGELEDVACVARTAAPELAVAGLTARGDAQLTQINLELNLFEHQLLLGCSRDSRDLALRLQRAEALVRAALGLRGGQRMGQTVHARRRLRRSLGLLRSRHHDDLSQLVHGHRCTCAVLRHCSCRSPGSRGALRNGSSRSSPQLIPCA